MKTKFNLVLLLASSLLLQGSSNAEPQFKLDLNKAFNALQSVKKAIVPLTEEEEILLGQSIASNLLSLAPLHPDTALQSYVNQVGRWIASRSERPDLPWTFAVLDNEDINAFATPGGYIVLTKGLLLKLNSEAELAGVLGHEIGHVLKKHHLNAMQKAHAKTALQESASLVMDARGNKNQDVLKYAAIGTELYGKGLDKEDEFESDRIGVVLATRAGYEPYGLPAVLQTLQSVVGGSATLQLLLETHPKPADRLNQLDHIMQQGFDQYEQLSSGQERYKAMMVRLAKN